MNDTRKLVVVCVVFGLGLTSSGCITSTKKLEGVIQSGPTLVKWDEQLVLKYTKPGTNGLAFIEEYNRQYPADLIQYDHIDVFAKREALLDARLQTELDRIVNQIKAAEARRMDLTIKQSVAEIGNSTLQKDLKANIDEVDLEIKNLTDEAYNTQAQYYDEKAARIDVDKQLPANLVAEIAKLNEDVQRISIEGNPAASDNLAQIEVRLGALRKLALATGDPQAILEVMRIERNKRISELMIIAKRVHDEKDNYLHYGRAGMNLGFDAAQLTSTAAAAVVGSESTARVLATFATLAKGGQESIDKRLFYQQATSALIRIMHAQRLAQELTLRTNMADSVIDYPLETAVNDYATFLMAGGLTDALAELGSDAKEKEDLALKALDELKALGAEAVKLREAEAVQKAAEQAKKRAQMDAFIQQYLPAGTVLPPRP